MTSSISTEPHPATRAMLQPQRKGKSVTGIHPGPAIHIRPDTPHYRINSTIIVVIPTRQGRATTSAPYGRYLPCYLVEELRA